MVDEIVNPARVHRRPLEALLSPAARANAPLVAALLAAALFLACGEAGQPGSDSGDGASGGDFGDATGDGDGGEGGDDPSGDGDNGQAADGYVCSFPDECVAVSSTCCGCPDFAARADSDYAAACDDVECEEPVDCPKVVPDCVDSLCALVCEPIVATRMCEHGFARDSRGCLQNLCRTDPPDPVFACEGDADCTQVSADCCGCERGGADTAVNVGQVDAYRESLACRGDPECPGLDVCDVSQEPRCLAGGCTLAPSDDGGGTDDGSGDGDGDGGDGPPEADTLCGAPEFPPCPTGQVCVLNYQDAEDATRIGVGTCREPLPDFAGRRHD
jgi:hypothetical protein